MKAQRSLWISSCILLGALAFTPGCDRKKPTTNEPMYKPNGPTKTKLAVKLVKWEPFPGGAELVVPERLGRIEEGTGKIITRLFVSSEVVLTNDDIVGTTFTSRPDEPDWGRLQVFLTPAGQERVARISREHPGSSLAIFFADELELVATIGSELPDGIVEITGWFRGTEGTDLAQRLVGRSLPVAAQQPPVLLAPVPHVPFLGTWVVESTEALGMKTPDKDAGGMKLTFHPDKATWHFRLPDGWKSFDGTLRYNSTSEPKEIDLSQPNNPNKVAYGIYKIEGNALTITMGAERPKTFDEPSWAKMVFRRE